MERRKVEHIDDILPRFLREEGIETPLNEWRTIDAWAKVVGDEVAAMSSDLKIYNQVLYVHILSPALKANLQMQRTSLVARLTELVGAHTIYDIRFV